MMARMSRRFSRGSNPRTSQWLFSLPTAPPVSIAPNNRVGFQLTRPFDGLAAVGEPTIIDPTLVRIRGTYGVNITDAGGGYLELFMGIIRLQPDTAGNVIAAQLPDPLANPEVEWIWNEYIAAPFGSDGLVFNATIGSSGTTLDSKAKRVMRANDVLAFVYRTTTLTSATITVSHAVRMLFKGARRV